jgi:hypothetical protein
MGKFRNVAGGFLLRTDGLQINRNFFSAERHKAFRGHGRKRMRDSIR